MGDFNCTFNNATMVELLESFQISSFQMKRSRLENVANRSGNKNDIAA